MKCKSCGSKMMGLFKKRCLNKKCPDYYVDNMGQNGVEGFVKQTVSKKKNITPPIELIKSTEEEIKNKYEEKYSDEIDCVSGSIDYLPTDCLSGEMNESYNYDYHEDHKQALSLNIENNLKHLRNTQGCYRVDSVRVDGPIYSNESFEIFLNIWITLTKDGGGKKFIRIKSNNVSILEYDCGGKDNAQKFLSDVKEQVMLKLEDDGSRKYHGEDGGRVFTY